MRLACDLCYVRWLEATVALLSIDSDFKNLKPLKTSSSPSASILGAGGAGRSPKSIHQKSSRLVSGPGFPEPGYRHIQDRSHAQTLACFSMCLAPPSVTSRGGVSVCRLAGVQAIPVDMQKQFWQLQNTPRPHTVKRPGKMVWIWWGADP